MTKTRLMWFALGIPFGLIVHSVTIWIASQFGISFSG